MPQFTTLQKKVFPLYFQLQVGLTGIVILTHPPSGLPSLIRSHWWEYVPLAVAFGVSVANLYVYGPRTERLMVQRIHQGERPILFVF